MDELTREFLIETQEGLDRMERGLTDLEERTADPELLAEIFRCVHTIKGTSGFLGFSRLEKLTHSGENLLGLLRDGDAQADDAIVSALLDLLDRLRGILRLIEQSDADGEAAEDVELITRLDSFHSCAEARAASERRRSSAAGLMQDAMSVDCTPALGSGERDFALDAPAVLEKMASSRDETAPSSAAKPQESNSQNGLTAAETTLRVDITLLNRMMNLVGELVLTRNQVLQATATDAKLMPLSRRLDKVTADLRESVMRARMQPVSNIFSKVPRIVREVSRLLGRRVRLEMEGQETELDKSLLEAIKDPLTHAVRNALDHGIESPEARLAAGKTAEGTLTLRAFQEASHVIVEVADDGAGIDVDRVRAKAIERDLVSAERAIALSDRELLQLIFLPGFSTAAEVTSVSGRGVGMDVVRTNVEKIGGKVEIESRSGEGTTLRMRIPLTLAIIPALIVRSAGQNFAVPQGSLSELLQAGTKKSSHAIEWIGGTPVLRLRSHLLPLVFLDTLLLPGGGQCHSGTKKHFIAVLEAEGLRYGLVIDGLADPEEIVVKPLDSVLKQVGIYSGATVLGNGDLALILDPASLAAHAKVPEADEEEQSDAVEQKAQEDEFLVVELGARRAAIPVSQVLRIERVPVSRIEHVDAGLVLRIDRELLAVQDPAGLLMSPETRQHVEVVICRTGSGQAGVAVEKVFNVAAGSELFDAGTLQSRKGTLLIGERVTTVMSASEGDASVPGEEMVGIHECAEVEA